MKKSVEILGLPVIDISEGVEIGTVKQLVINPTEGAIAALVIDDGKWYLGAKLLPFANIAGLGESALTIISESSVTGVASAPELEQLLAANVTVIGSTVLTKTGSILGKVTEITADTAGKIAVCEMQKADGEIVDITAEQVLTFGKKVLIIADAAETAAPAPTPVAVQEEVSAPVAEVEIPAEVPAEVPAEASAKKADDSAKKFDEKQRKYLLGKQASRRIETDNGVLIVEQGGEINEEVLQKAKLAGKFVELSMNVQ